MCLSHVSQFFVCTAELHASRGEKGTEFFRPTAVVHTFPLMSYITASHSFPRNSREQRNISWLCEQKANHCNLICKCESDGNFCFVSLSGGRDGSVKPLNYSWEKKDNFSLGSMHMFQFHLKGEREEC